MKKFLISKLSLNFNQKLFFVYMAIVIIILTLGLFIYYSIIHFKAINYGINIYIKNQEQVFYKINAIEQKVNSIYTQFATDYVITEWIQDSYRPVIDYYSLYNTHRRFINLINSDPEIASIYLFSAGNNKVLSTPFTFSDLDTFAKKNLFERFLQQKKKSIWFEAQSERPQDANSKTIIPFVSRIPFSSDIGVLAINLDEKLIYSNLGLGNECTVIMDRDNNVIASRDSKLYSNFAKNIENYLNKESSLNNITYFFCTYNETSYYLFVSNFSNYNWKVITIVPYNMVVNKSENDYNYIGLIILLCSLAALGLLAILKKIYSKPIETYINKIDDLKDNLVSQILTGKIIPKEINAKAREIQFDLSFNWYLVGILKINDYYNYLVNMNNIDSPINNSIILNAIKYMFKTDFNTYIVKVDSDKFALLLILDEVSRHNLVMERVKDTIQYIQKEIKQNYNLSICCGISDIANDIRNVHECYIQALNSVQYSTIYGRNSIIFYNDIVSSRHFVNSYPIESLDEINEYIRQGDIPKVENCLNNIFTQLITSQCYPVDLINGIFTSILFNLVKLVLEFNHTLSDIFSENIFINLYSHDLMDEKKAYMLYVCKQIINFNQENAHILDKHLIMKINNYISQNFDKTISLSMLANEMSMNPTYLSVLIKKKMGVNFVDYVNDLRIKKSVSMLKYSHSTIKQIANACGYENVHSFIRNFKKYYFLTPSEFRIRELGKQV